MSLLGQKLDTIAQEIFNAKECLSRAYSALQYVYTEGKTKQRIETRRLSTRLIDASGSMIEAEEELHNLRKQLTMSIPTVYVQGASKAAINRELQSGHRVPCVEYSFLTENKSTLDVCRLGTVVKIWSKCDHAGTPIAKAYGTWNGKKLT